MDSGFSLKDSNPANFLKIIIKMVNILDNPLN